jgi:hypothetical protein
MSEQKTVFNKLWKSNSTELASHKVELAKKAPAILSEIKKIDDSLMKSESKIDSVFLAYKKAYSDFQDVLSSSENSANSLERDLVGIMDAAQELGLNPNDAMKIDGFKEAADLVTKIQTLVPKLKTLYQKPS